MAHTIDIYLDTSTDQELVDLYTSHAPSATVTEITHSQIRNSSGAAYALERRGYVEQAGTWLHSSLPSLQATA